VVQLPTLEEEKSYRSGTTNPSSSISKNICFILFFCNCYSNIRSVLYCCDRYFR